MTHAATDLEAALSALRADAGVGYGAIRRMLCHLAATGEPDLGRLVEATGVPHRRVLEVLRRLGFDASDREVLGDGAMLGRLRGLLACEPAPEPADFAEQVEGVAGGLLPSVWDLDQVPATVGTILRRARYLAGEYDLARHHLVCLGDHDLTSVSTKLLCPAARVSVVDVDEGLLAYLDEVSGRLGLDLRLFAADLRLGLPRSLREGADLVFTDPPYSREGVDLFVRRGVEALGDRPGASVLFCYGAGDRGSEALLAVQEQLARLHLVIDALVPGFNRYRGAHAIGAASSLWVVRPTRRTRPAAAAADAHGLNARVYSRGKASREAVPMVLGDEIRPAVEGVAWVDARSLLHDAVEPRPRGPLRRWPDRLAVDLSGFGAPTVSRLLMGAPGTSELYVVADARAASALAHDPFQAFVGARFRTEVLVGGASTLIRALPTQPDELDDAGWVLQYLAEHQSALVRNAWREALCALAARRGGSCTKNEARERIEAAGLSADDLDLHLLELPVQSLGRLLAAIRATVA